jgi:hypothetical protein
MAGIKYTTFANWRQQCRKQSGGEAAVAAGGAARARRGTPSFQLLEAVVEEHRPQRSETSSATGLVLELPGGCRLRVETPVQLAMAAELVSLVAQSTGARC